jgi:hypothetical protein
MPSLATIGFNEFVQPLAKLDPASQTTAQSTGWVDVSGHARIAALLMVGAIASTGTLNAKLEAATSSGGAGAADITGKAIAAQADTADNLLHVIDLDVSELNTQNQAFTHVRLTVTPATAATIFGAVLVGYAPRHLPVAQTLYSSVVR